MKNQKTPSSEKQSESRLSPRTIAFIYALVGGLWILASDWIVELISSDPRTITQLQTYKGWFYVVMTALMLYGLVRLYGNRLVESNRRTAEILESISDGFFALDEELAVTYFNKAAEELLGPRSTDLLGRKFFEAFPEAKGSALEQQYARALREKRSITFEIYFDIKPYENWYGVRVYPLGQGIAIYFQVITERKKAEAALNESRRQEAILADLLERSSQPFAVRYPDARLGRVNSAFSRLTGYSKEELMTIDVRVLTPPEWQDNEQQKLEELMQTGQPVRYEKEYVRKDGSRVPVEILAHIVRDEHGSLKYYYAFITDISERKRVEEALRESEERFRSTFEHAAFGMALVVKCQDIGYPILMMPKYHDIGYPMP